MEHMPHLQQQKHAFQIAMCNLMWHVTLLFENSPRKCLPSKQVQAFAGPTKTAGIPLNQRVFQSWNERVCTFFTFCLGDEFKANDQVRGRYSLVIYEPFDPEQPNSTLLYSAGTITTLNTFDIIGIGLPSHMGSNCRVGLEIQPLTVF